ncbi:MAG: glycosyltransferase family 2 protein [Ardenticatenia bacterium]|nr:glycosyltransferase family 2 protein [Ardenticatenia bacterium]
MVRTESPEARLVPTGRTWGFAGGNTAALRARGFAVEGSDKALPGIADYVLFHTSDPEGQEDAFSRMLDFLRANPPVGVVGAALVYPDGGVQHSAFHFPTLPQVWFDFFAWPGRFIDSPVNGRYPRSLYVAGDPFPVDHPLGAAMMTRAEVIRQVGFMDEDFFMYAEEIDWCMQVKRRGWDVYCVPSARIVHHSGASTRQAWDQMTEMLWRSRFHLFEKHYSLVFNLAARLLVRLGRWAGARCSQQ